MVVATAAAQLRGLPTSGSSDDREQAFAPDRGGITTFQGSTLHQPAR
jgi:hypothetical protein